MTSANQNEKIKITGAAKACLLLLAVLLSLPPLVGFSTDQTDRSRQEKRKLATLPAWQGWRELPAFFDQLGLYTDDHLGFTLPVNRFYRKLLFYGFSDSPVDYVTVGESGAIFLNSHVPDMQNDIFSMLCLNGTDLERVTAVSRSLERIFAALESRHYRPSLGIAVSKPVLYPDLLPAGVPESLRQACLSYGEKSNVPTLLSRTMREAGKAVFYPYRQFYRHRNEKAFYPKGNYHWHGESAHLFARDFLGLLGIAPDTDFARGRALKEVDTDIQAIGFKHPVMIWHYPYEQFGVTKKGVAKMPHLKKYYQRAYDCALFETENPLSERRALVISNSFGAGVARHLAPGFRTLHQVNINSLQEKEYPAFFGEYIDLVHPTDIIFIYHEYNIMWGFPFSDIADVLTGKTQRLEDIASP